MMIEINLLPQELRTKSTRTALDPRLAGIILVIAGILVSVHILLGLGQIVRNIQLAALNFKWQQLQPQKQRLDTDKKERELLTSDSDFVLQLLTQRVSWAEKLNKLSLCLPSGVWFTEVSVTPTEFNLKASVVSLKKEEMALINKFMSNLKSDSAFFTDFANLELVSAQRRFLGAYEVVDFVLKGSLKTK